MDAQQNQRNEEKRILISSIDSVSRSIDSLTRAGLVSEAETVSVKLLELIAKLK